jgi:hypothetical protein
MRAAVLFLLCAAIAAPATSGEPTTALLIIDIQDFYFPGGKVPLVEPEAAAANAARVLAAFRAEGKPVVHVRHEFEPGGSIHASVAPIDGEKVFIKTEVSCFNGTQVLAHLEEMGIKKLVIVGMQTQGTSPTVTGRCQPQMCTPRPSRPSTGPMQRSWIRRRFWAESSPSPQANRIIPLSS